MRKLFVLKGAPGSGKTTFIRENGLEDLAVGYDQMRQLFSSYLPTLDGPESLSLDPTVESDIVSLTQRAVANRMEQGATIIIDATALSAKQQSPWVKLGQKYGYRAYLVDMQQELSDEELLERNRGRGRHCLPEERVLEMAARGRARSITGGITAITPQQMLDELTVPVLDFEGYDRVVLVGDVQSCAQALRAGLVELAGVEGAEDTEGNPADANLADAARAFDDPHTAWIFTGDLFDRGPDAADVFSLVETPRENVFFVMGNHDLNLLRIINHTGSKRYIDTRTSLHQITEAGYTSKQVLSLVVRMRPFIVFRFGGSEFVVSHGGIATRILEETREVSPLSEAGGGLTGERLRVGHIPDWVFTYGLNPRSFTWQARSNYLHCDEELAQGSTLGQFHGHRNGNRMQEPEEPGAVPGVWNLEGGVDQGGHLRIAVISRLEKPEDSGHQTESSRTSITGNRLGAGSNPASVSIWEGTKVEIHTYRDLLACENFAATQGEVGSLSERMAQHPNIRVKDIGDGICAYNFTRDAFVNGLWDRDTCAARGLFLRGDKVMARGYQKFFNMDEPAGYTREQLLSEFVYPVRSIEKVNGFLALVASVNRRLVVYTKAGPTEYAEAARALLWEAFTEEQRAQMATVLRHENCTLAVEIILANDPHIVDNIGQNRFVVLDAIANQEDFLLRPGVVDAVAEAVGGELPRPALRGVARDMAELNDLIEAGICADDEGVVLIDATGKMGKIKSEFYRRRKRLRSALQRVLNGKAEALPQEFATEEAWLRETGRWDRLTDFLVTSPTGNLTLHLPRLLAK